MNAAADVLRSTQTVKDQLIYQRSVSVMTDFIVKMKNRLYTACLCMIIKRNECMGRLVFNSNTGWSLGVLGLQMVLNILLF